MAAKKQKKITVVAELSVTAGDRSETVRSFDKAWHLGREWAQEIVPVEISFLRFVPIREK